MLCHVDSEALYDKLRSAPSIIVKSPITDNGQITWLNVQLGSITRSNPVYRTRGADYVVPAGMIAVAMMP